MKQYNFIQYKGRTEFISSDKDRNRQRVYYLKNKEYYSEMQKQRNILSNLRGGEL